MPRSRARLGPGEWPLRAHDNAWWWDGIERGELLIQRCSDCGKLRHPPRPMCGACQSLRWDSIAASGRGVVYSHVVMHHPPIPGYGFPLAVALIELEEGPLLLSQLQGVAVDKIAIGMDVTVAFIEMDSTTSLPVFHPRSHT